jgi:NADP-dependent 3-hydroxy acid dehydrogenase YdfG
MASIYQKVLIIGATSGIGKGLAGKFVENNVSLIVAGRREQNLAEFVNQHAGQNVQSKVFDITKLDQVGYSEKTGCAFL